MLAASTLRERVAAPTRCTIILMTSGFQVVALAVESGTRRWWMLSVETRQNYVEDCQVCCKPNVLRIDWDRESDEYVVSAELE